MEVHLFGGHAVNSTLGDSQAGEHLLRSPTSAIG